jgi:hypothetical protein
MSEKPEVSKNIGAANPYALAEVVLKRRINWKRTSNPQKLLEKALNVPYEKLFDPVNESPLYPGIEVEPETRKLRMMKDATKRDIVKASVKGNVVWQDPGDFYEEGTELTDPVQGGVPNCYYIAALSSIAWARPYVIAQRTRATGTGQQDFVDMIEFFPGVGTKTDKIEVTEKVPMIPPSTFIYARSSEPGEIWPAVYEKAFAKWKTKVTTDTPDIAKTAYGDPVGALVSLTGLTPYYFSNKQMAAHDIWQTVRANSISAKTFNPMVASTYGSAPSPDVNYSSAQIAANHAYSILGWSYVSNQEYIILRNPWGNYESTLNVTGGSWVAWDQPYYGGPGWWRPINLPANEGIFSLRSDTFKKYFESFGYVKTPESP